MNRVINWFCIGAFTLLFLNWTGPAGNGLLAYAAPPATAQTSSSHENTAVIPALAPGLVKQHEANVAIAKKGDIDLLFMGDSITDWWWRSEGPRPRASSTRRSTTNPATQPAPPVPGAYAGKPVFNKYFRQMKVANFGLSSDTTQGVLYRLQHGEGEGFSPKAIMLLIGTNNTGKNTAEEVADGVKADVDELRKDFPQAKILLMAIFPRNGPPASRQEIAEINPILAKLDDNQHVFYMDLTRKLTQPDGTVPRDIMSDGLHPTTKGYEIWAEAVIGPLKRMMEKN